MTESMDKVIKAAEELDRMVGKVSWLTADWREKIDLDKLDMNSCRDCILGQLEGYYSHAIDDLGPKGFRGGDGAFARFDDEWIEYLKVSDKFAKGAKWICKSGSGLTMTIQGSVEIDGKDKVYVYLTDIGDVIARSASYIESAYRPAPKVPDFKVGEEVVFPNNKLGIPFYFLSGDQILRVGSVPHIVSLKAFASTYGAPIKGERNISATLGSLKEALNK